MRSNNIKVMEIINSCPAAQRSLEATKAFFKTIRINTKSITVEDHEIKFARHTM